MEERIDTGIKNGSMLRILQSKEQTNIETAIKNLE